MELQCCTKQIHSTCQQGPEDTKAPVNLGREKVRWSPGIVRLQKGHMRKILVNDPW